MRCKQTNMISIAIVAILCGGSLVAAPARRAASATVTFVDINPDNEGPMVGQPGVVLACPDPCASGRNGGRVNGLAGVPGDASRYFAASETAGIFKTEDGGLSWKHLDGHVPSQTWDVAAAPGAQRVYATSFYDGRVVPLTGLEVSKDGGSTWNRPSLSPPSCSPERQHQPSGFGIALRPGTGEVFVGTNCGIARSPDAGDTWVQFDPTPGDGTANSVWDVVAVPGGRTYACGDDGLLTSPDGAVGTWQGLLPKPNPFPGGFCSLAVSPDEPNVVFVVFGNPVLFGELFLGRSGAFFEGRIDFSASPPSVTWTNLPYPDMDHKKQRAPFLATNKRAQGFDLWVGDGSLWRVPCSAQQTPSCTTDTTQWSGSFTDDQPGSASALQNAHGDSGYLVFDPTKNVDACPTLYSSDGGIHRNDATLTPACHDPVFRGANVGMHAFLVWGMAGVGRLGVENEDLYFGVQDNGLYFTATAGANPPTWIHGIGADVFDVVADQTRMVATNGQLLTGDPGFQNVKSVVSGFPATSISECIAETGVGQYMMVVKKEFQFPSGTTIPVGVRQTNDIVLDPLGSPLGAWPATAQAPCHIQVGIGPAGPQPYVLAGTACVLGRLDVPANQLWTYKGGIWTQIFPPPTQPGDPVASEAGFGLIAVDPVNPDRLYASIVRDGPPRMMRSNNGGVNWKEDEELTNLMSGGGKFEPYPIDPGDGIIPYLQPLMVTFDRKDPNILIAGGYFSGVFLSSTGGESWTLLTDPFSPGASGIPHLTRPLFAYFDHDAPATVRVYLATGRGIWRIDLASTDLSITKSNLPDPVVTGSNITYSITVRNNGPNTSGSITLTDNLPSNTTFESLTSPFGWSCVTPPVGDGGTVTCKRTDMPAGTQELFTLVAKVKCSVADGTVIINSAMIGSALPDPTLGNNTVIAMTHASNPPPSITCPSSVTVECTGNSGIQASDPQLAAFFAGASASDNCSGINITNDAPSFFALGTTTVTFLATDGGGASSSCTATVSVADTTAPQITVSLQPDVLLLPNHKLVDIVATVQVVDACDPHPTFVLTSISSNEPDNGLGDGDKPFDIQGYDLGTPDTAFRLRAERSGLGSGRIYTIVYTASDESGNTAQATGFVEVPHDQVAQTSGEARQLLDKFWILDPVVGSPGETIFRTKGRGSLRENLRIRRTE